MAAHPFGQNTAADLAAFLELKDAHPDKLNNGPAKEVADCIELFQRTSIGDIVTQIRNAIAADHPMPARAKKKGTGNGSGGNAKPKPIRKPGSKTKTSNSDDDDDDDEDAEMDVEEEEKDEEKPGELVPVNRKQGRKPEAGGELVPGYDDAALSPDPIKQAAQLSKFVADVTDGVLREGDLGENCETKLDFARRAVKTMKNILAGINFRVDSERAYQDSMRGGIAGATVDGLTKDNVRDILTSPAGNRDEDDDSDGAAEMLAEIAAMTDDEGFGGVRHANASDVSAKVVKLWKSAALMDRNAVANYRRSLTA